MVTNINGKSARILLDSIIANETLDSEKVSQMVHGRLLSKIDDIMQAIDGITTPLQRKLIAQILVRCND